MKDILVIMPETLEAYLAAISAVQALREEQKILTGKDQKFVVCSNDKFNYLWPALPTEDIISSVEPVRGQYELVYSFDEQIAYELSLPTKRHMAEVFGILIGSSAKTLPDLSKVKIPVYEDAVIDIDVLVLPYKDKAECSLIKSLTGKCGLPFSVGCLGLNDKAADWVANAKLVVGPRCGATYLAAALGKIVVEIYPTDRHKGWLSKWSSQKYRMFYEDNPDVDRVCKVVEEAWTTYQISVPGQ